MPRMNSTLRVKIVSAMSRYLLPPMSKTMYGATKSAVLKRLFHLREARPSRPFGDSIPAVYGAAGMRMLLTEDPNRLVADGVHLGPMPWPQNGNSLSIRRRKDPTLKRRDLVEHKADHHLFPRLIAPADFFRWIWVELVVRRIIEMRHALDLGALGHMDRRLQLVS
jgi:hypothetical protein